MFDRSAMVEVAYDGNRGASENGEVSTNVAISVMTSESVLLSFNRMSPHVFCCDAER